MRSAARSTSAWAAAAAPCPPPNAHASTTSTTRQRRRQQHIRYRSSTHIARLPRIYAGAVPWAVRWRLGVCIRATLPPHCGLTISRRASSSPKLPALTVIRGSNPAVGAHAPCHPIPRRDVAVTSDDGGDGDGSTDTWSMYVRADRWLRLEIQRAKSHGRRGVNK
jgi:hypothetical protein